MTTNEFAKASKLVEDCLSRYREIRKDCGISDVGWHSRTIERMAKPFRNGYFTIAIVGKVSSGKSTFINTLLGCKNLLPTGHDQTTCGITYIEYGEKPEVTITFGDGKKKIIKEDICGKIKNHVAIPEKFHHLPVNNIDEMILGGYGFNQIWESRKILEDETLCSPIDERILKEYVENRCKADIAVEVHMKYPFNEELKGWRIIDTPGIGAIGGIESRTKQLLATQKEDGTREVDAIIFLQNGSQTLDQTDSKKFVKEQLENLTESDKNRLFYILTHSSSSEFLNHKESKIDFINHNYGDKIKVLSYVDSLLYTFLDFVESNNLCLDEYEDFEQSDNWSDDEWDVIMNILGQAKRKLKKMGDSYNHDTMLRILREWSNFEELKNKINVFAREEKYKTLCRILNLIANDYLGFRKQLEKDEEIVDGDLTTINKEIEKVDKKKQEYNIIAQKADNLIRIERIKGEFKFVDDRLYEIEKLESINKVRTFVTNLFDDVQRTEKKVFEDIVEQFSSFFNEFDSNDIVLRSIDFSAIEYEATKRSKETYLLEPERVVKQKSKDEVIIPAKYSTRINHETKIREFKALVLKTVRVQKDSLLPQIKEKLDNMRDQINFEVKTKMDEEKKRYENLKTQLGCKEEFKAKNDSLIEKSYIAGKELINKALEYGIEF